MPANPQSEQELLSRAYAMAGFTLAQLAATAGIPYRGISGVTRAGQGS
jgi:DNA mismatch repair protein MutH